MMAGSELGRLQAWYRSHCDGDWEHDSRIAIITLDNPGWSVNINFTETELEDRQFQPVEVARNDMDWVYCWVESNHFNGAGGPQNLTEILGLFLDWSEMKEVSVSLSAVDVTIEGDG